MEKDTKFVQLSNKLSNVTEMLKEDKEFMFLLKEFFKEMKEKENRILQ